MAAQYIVQGLGLPFYFIYGCGRDTGEFCPRSLRGDTAFP